MTEESCSNAFVCSVKKNGKARIPSMCDKILYALSDNINSKINIKDKSFEVYNNLRKSDHKVVSLLIDL